jgi:acyl-phosphate glycerol 3-phosphate acyltransferase
MPLAAVGLLLAAVYLVGALPFGYLVARAKGVDLFKAGSGNIGATNVGRVLGRKYGILVFVLDFLKGAVPVAAVVPASAALDPDAPTALGSPDVLRVAAAALVFGGHLFPVYLGFRGGKGVATGAGAVAVLVPGPAAAAIAAWAVVTLASRFVSLGSLVAAGVLVAVRAAGTPDPLAGPGGWVTGFCGLAAGMVAWKHRANVGRLVRGTENAVGDGPMRQSLLRVLHVLAVGTWFGGAGFFSFAVAPAQNRAFREVVLTAPNDRTAGLPLVPPGATEETRTGLASALFGAAVGPVFPAYFALQAACGGVAVVTALAWWNAADRRRLHRGRVLVLAVALASVAVGWALSEEVSRLRAARFDPDPAVTAAAKEAFGPWHFASLGLSVVTVGLAGVGLGLAGFLPDRPAAQAGDRPAFEG